LTNYILYNIYRPTNFLCFCKNGWY